MSYQDFLKFKKDFENNGVKKAAANISPKTSPISSNDSSITAIPQGKNVLDEVFNTVVRKGDTSPWQAPYNPTEGQNPQWVESIGAASNAALNSATLGLKPLIEKKYFPEQYKASQDVIRDNPKSAMAGNLAGYVLPSIGAAKVVKSGATALKNIPTIGGAVRELLPATDTIGKIAKAGLYGGAEGALMGAVEGTNEGIREGYNLGDTFQNAIDKSAELGAYGLALGGTLKGVGTLGKNLYGNTVGFNKALQRASQGIDNYQFPQIREPQLLPLPEKPSFNPTIPLKYQKPTPNNMPLALPPAKTFTPPQVPTQFRTEIAGDVSRPILGQKFNPTESILSRPNVQGDMKLPPLKNNALNEPLNATEFKPNIQSNIEPISNVKILESNVNLPSKNRQFIENSFLNSEVPTPKMKTEMKQNIPQYEPLTNKETLDKAMSKVDSEYDSSLREFLSSSKLGGADDTALGQALIQRAISKGKYTEANDIAINLAEKLTNAGQTVQAASIFKRMTPEGMLQYANKTINKANKELQAKAGNKAIEKIKLTPEETKFITDTMSEINTKLGNMKIIPIDLQMFADGKLAEVMKLIASKIPANMGEKIKSFQRINLLFNPKTMIRNLAGNVISSGVANIKDVLATGIDKGVSKLTGKRTMLLPSLKAQVQGGKKGFDRVVRDYRQGINTAPTGTQYEIDGRTISPFKNKPLQKLDELTRTGLRLADDPFYQSAYDDVLRREMKLKGVDTPTPEMVAKADQIARERTFQDTNRITEIFTFIQRGLNRIGTKNFGLGNVIIPFVKTPANILARVLEYSPIELVKVTNQLYNAVAKNGKFDQYKFVDSLAKSLTGTALIGAGYTLAEKGIISGASSKDKDARNFESTVGILPYSFKVGGKTYTYDWAQPSSIPIAMGADIYYNQLKSKKPENVFWNAILSGTETLFSQSLLQGLNKLFGGNSFTGGNGIAENLANTALSATSQFIPLGSLQRQIGEISDPFKRETADESVIKSKVVNPFLNTNPFTRQTLPPKINTVGEPVKANGLFDTMINPARSSDYNGNPVYDELLRLNSQANENKQFPTTATNKISYKTSKGGEAQNLMLTPDQLASYKTRLGQSNLQALQKEISSSNYQNMNDKQKADALSKALAASKQQAENEFLKSVGINEYQASSGSRSRSRNRNRR